MPRSLKDHDRIAEAAGSVSVKTQFPANASLWLWTLLIMLTIIMGGTNIAYPLMRTLSGTGGAILLAVAVTSRSSRWTRPILTDWVLAGIVALFAIQLIPLPPVLWTHLAGREAIQAIDREVFGQPLWRPLSINSEATWHTFAFLIPFFGAYLAYRSGSTLRRAALMRGVAIGFTIAVALGLLQTAGLDFLHPFPIEADNQFGNGFFTNHNHQTTFVVMAALLLACHPKMPQRGLLDPRLIALAVATILATIASGSRAGFVLMLAAALAFGAFWLVTRSGPPGTKPASSRPFALALVGAALVAAILSALVIGADRFALGRGSLLEDQRLEISPIAWQAIWQFWPTGSGFGTFQTPYRQVEPIEALRILDVTHAHNDLLEVAIEGGALALALILVQSIRVLSLTGQGLRKKGTEGMRTAVIGLALVVPLVHSLVDYPLRTMSIAVLFAVALASLEARASATPVTNA
jgi:hypothetical protein